MFISLVIFFRVFLLVKVILDAVIYKFKYVLYFKYNRNVFFVYVKFKMGGLIGG